jgi:hypothetical protein
MTKNQRISRDVNGTTVEQRVMDGFINATAMCVAHNKDISDWLALNATFDLVTALAARLSIDPNSGNSPNSVKTRVSTTYPSIVIVKRGSPEKGGGTWIHPKLAVHLAQWCSSEFALQVSDWIEEWMTSGKNPIWKQGDIDRVIYRDTLKDESRTRMTNQVKIYLTQIQRYDDQKYRGIFFARVHDAINVAIVGETAKQMRIRLGQLLGRDIKESELIRDYYPALALQQYISVCEAVANFMIREGLHPLTAVERATEIVLPANHQRQPIDFSEHIKFVRQRLSQPVLGQENLKFLP